MKILHMLPSCRVGNGAAKLVLDIIPFQLEDGDIVDVAVLQETNVSYKADFQKIGCKVYTLSSVGSSLFNPLFIHKIKNIICSYDIVHLHLFPTFYWAVLAKIIFNLKCKLIFTEHSTLNNRQRWYLRPIERFIYSRLDKIIAISDAAKDCLLNHLKMNIDVNVIVNGINILAYSNASPIDRGLLNIPYDAILITQVARFAPQKDQHTVLKVISELPTNYHAVFVGRGELLDKHIEIAKVLNISDRVHFLGVRKDVPSILMSSDIVVMSSNFEGFGLAAVEGMAAGKPVIASNVPGVAEIVSGAGLLFELRSVEELKECIIKLSDNEFYHKITSLCRNRADLFSIDITARKYKQLYYN